MRIRSILLLLLLVACAFVLRAQAPDTGKNSAGQPGKAVNVMQYMREYLSKFPPGTDLPASRFGEVLDKTGADALRKLGVTRVVNVGNSYSVSFAKGDERPLGKKADLRYAKVVSFTYLDRNGTVTISDIHGAEVKVSFLLGWMDLKNVTLTRDDTTGNTTVVAEVHVLFRDFSHTIVLGPDGKPLDKNKK